MLSTLTWMTLACVARPAPEQAPTPPATTIEEAPVAAEARKTNPDLSLDWTLERSGQELRVRYSLSNHGKSRIYVVDQLYTGRSGPRTPAPDRVVVAPSDKADTVRFVRGVVEVQNTIVEFDATPGATFVDPGQTHEGTATVALPLVGWHPYAPPDPLPADPKFATLEIATLAGEGEWGTVPLDGGGTLTVPQLGYYFRDVVLVNGGAKPIP